MTARCIATACAASLLLISTACGKKPAADGVPKGAPGGMATQVIAVPVKKTPISESISLVGSIAPNEMIDVRSEVDGLVTEINFDEGQRVEKGQLLVALDASKFQAQLSQTEANLKLAQSSFDRTRQLLADHLISQQEFDTASATFAANQAAVELRRREMKDTRIVTPFAGIAGARLISAGQVISKATQLTSVVDLDTVKVEVNVPERYLRQLRIGQTVGFNVAAYPGEKFTGEVYFIAPQLDTSTRTALVKARIANPDLKLRGGMFAGLDLSLQLREAALVIPEPSIINNGDITMVFAITPSNTAVMKPVKVGLRIAGKAEVVSGLTEGEMVVVEGVQKLRPGAPVKLGPEEAAAPYKD
jgi:membrane fusion protein (multidrug efflux system)